MYNNSSCTKQNSVKDMDQLKQNLSAMSATVASRNSSGQNPTVEQLTAFVKNISEALEKITSHLAPRVREIVQSGFQSGLGWNFRTKTVSKAVLFNPANLLTTLNDIKAEVDNWSPAVAPTSAELASVSLACSKLWELDHNRLIPGHDYELNLQRGKNFSEQGDAASEPLFSFVDEKVFDKPTYRAFRALLDNYSSATGVSEVVTAEETAENNRFLNAIMDTAAMQYTHQYLLAHKKTTATTREAFIQFLHQAWFELYGRKTANDSSGFEHVFIGEVKDGSEVSGLHNWVQLYLEERKGRLDYRGFIKPRRKARGPTQPDNCNQMVSIQFSWGGCLKPVSSSFIGTSPEFEMALYTLCFFMGQEENVVSVGPYTVSISCHKWTQRGKTYISTSFPGEAPLDQDEAASRIQAQFKGKQVRQVGAQEYSRHQGSRSAAAH